MAIPLKVPEVGESITDVEIGAWLKAEGDHVERDEDIVVVETEKATVQISAPQSGTITKILKQTGESATVGEIIGQLEEGAGEASRPPVKNEQAETAGGEAAAVHAAERDGEVAGKELRTESVEPIEIVPDAKKEEDIDSRREADEKKPAEQPRPRERKTTTIPGDEGANAPPLQIAARAKDDPLQPEPAAGLVRGPYDSRKTEREEGRARDVTGRQETAVRMTPLRRRIAERLVQAQHTSALLSTFNEIDMSGVNALRSRHRDTFSERYNVKLGLMSFFVKAAVEALKLVPEVNAEVRGENIVYRNFFDIGVAVGGGKGLVVPVLRNAERLSFAAIEQAIADFAQRAQANGLKPDELQGGTFTISNGGIYGSLLSTPIINPPQSGILGMHAIQERPVVRDGAVVVRPMMYVALTYDHRVVDGREAVTFLKHIKERIEDPARMLLEV
jgi:2-oxoglutarate dehydrogenase E2 component (dihydrolipoamide succinyltransferase)